MWKRQFVCVGSRCCECNTIQPITQKSHYLRHGGRVCEVSSHGDITLFSASSSATVFVLKYNVFVPPRVHILGCPDRCELKIRLMTPGAKLPIYHRKQWERRNPSYLDKAEGGKTVVKKKPWLMLSCDNAAPFHPSIHHHFIHLCLISYQLFSFSSNGLW